MLIKNEKHDLDNKYQSIKFHALELRRRIMFCLIAFLISFLILYPFSSYIFNFLVDPLYNILKNQDSKRLIYTGLSEAFLVHIKVSLFSSIVFSLPYILYQIWIFIAPGLYQKERRNFLLLFAFSPILFLFGILFTYFIIMPLAWSFFLSFETSFIGKETLPIQLEARIGEYFSLSLQLMLAFGLSFQLPVLLLLLSKLGLVTAKGLSKNRRYAVIIILIAAAFLTPPDVVSQIVLAIPLYGLYEMSIILINNIKIERYHDRS